MKKLNPEDLVITFNGVEIEGYSDSTSVISPRESINCKVVPINKSTEDYIKKVNSEINGEE